VFITKKVAYSIYILSDKQCTLLNEHVLLNLSQSCHNDINKRNACLTKAWPYYPTIFAQSSPKLSFYEAIRIYIVNIA